MDSIERILSSSQTRVFISKRFSLLLAASRESTSTVKFFLVQVRDPIGTLLRFAEPDGKSSLRFAIIVVVILGSQQYRRVTTPLNAYLKIISWVTKPRVQRCSSREWCSFAAGLYLFFFSLSPLKPSRTRKHFSARIVNFDLFLNRDKLLSY